MYKIYYLRTTDYGTEVFDKKTTNSSVTASKTFWEYRDNKEHESKKILLLLTQDSLQLVSHRFDKRDGQSDFVPLNQTLPSPLLSRHEIDWNDNAHRKKKFQFQVFLDPEDQIKLELAMEKSGTQTKKGFLIQCLNNK